MKTSWRYRCPASAAALFVAMGIGLVTAGAAGGAARTEAPLAAVRAPLLHRPPADRLQLRLDSGGATLRLPIPPCPTTSPGCVWMLYVSEPDVPGKPTVGMVTGTSGVLTIASPAGFCGVLQADALLGPAPWAFRTGERRTVGTCPAPTGGGATPPGAQGTTSTPVPAAVTASLPFSGGGTTAPSDGPGAQLPFTGFDPRPLVVLGTSSILGGGLLMSTAERNRRRLGRLRALGPRSLVNGVRRTGAWLLGL